MKTKLFIPLILISLACGKKSDNQIYTDSDVASVNMMNIEMPENKSKEVINTKQSFNENQKLIKTGNITFPTNNLDKTKNETVSFIKSLGGYISNDSQQKLNDRIQQTLIIRIPIKNFDNLVNKVIEIAEDIDERNISIEDVSEDFYDTETRIKNKKSVEIKYLDLLKKANKIEDILSIEGKLGEIRNEVETAEGHLKSLKDKISYSTLNVVFYKSISTPYSFSFQFSDAVRSGWSNLLEVLLKIISFWPFLIIIGSSIFVFKKYRK